MNRREYRNNDQKSGECNSDEKLDTCSKLDLAEQSRIEFTPKYETESLKQKLKDFISMSRSKTLQDIQETSASIHEGIKNYENSSKKFEVTILEHSHYIYSSLERRFFENQEELEIIKKRELQFDESEYPSDEHYNLLTSILEFISTLMCRWDIFDINNYGYRYKGRSLSVEIVDMNEINKKCIAPDIVWFTFAITHAPFKAKIEKALMLFGKILQHAINQVLEFFSLHDLSEEKFNLSRNFFFCRRKQTICNELYDKIKSLEISYRYFEKHLLEEFLKIV
jgi:hypothetical protein